MYIYYIRYIVHIFICMYVYVRKCKQTWADAGFWDRLVCSCSYQCLELLLPMFGAALTNFGAALTNFGAALTYVWSYSYQCLELLLPMFGAALTNDDQIQQNISIKNQIDLDFIPKCVHPDFNSMIRIHQKAGWRKSTFFSYHLIERWMKGWARSSVNQSGIPFLLSTMVAKLWGRIPLTGVLKTG